MNGMINPEFGDSESHYRSSNDFLIVDQGVGDYHEESFD